MPTQSLQGGIHGGFPSRPLLRSGDDVVLCARASLGGGVIACPAMRLSDFDYSLPEHLIAQHPPQRRGDSRLLHLPAAGAPRDLHFGDLPGLLRDDDLLVFNDTRVMRARLFGRKESGGRIEVLIERLSSPCHALAHVRASKSPRAGTRLFIDERIPLRVGGRRGDLFELHSPELEFAELMARHGHLPLPPYIRREDAAEDEERYQTVFAAREGAVAAPTAGLHFSTDILEGLRGRGIEMVNVTLHVGAGTFQPVRVENLDEHVMHAETIEVDEAAAEAVRAARSAGRRVVAIGTTTVRSLESAAAEGVIRPFRGDSRLFIRPGYRFNAVDAMLTNFHLPRSTLLMLVSAFSGRRRILAAYAHAVEREYRFFSYGDAMLLERGDG